MISPQYHNNILTSKVVYKSELLSVSSKILSLEIVTSLSDLNSIISKSAVISSIEENDLESIVYLTFFSILMKS